MRGFAYFAQALLLAGCSGALAKGDGRAFGDDMGRFHVKANLDSSTCGPGAVGAPANWEFDVILSKMAPSVYWNTGANAVEGTLSNDNKAFSFESETVVNVGNGAGGASSGAGPASTDPSGETCAVIRTDDSSGTFNSPDTVTSFAGTLEYHFALEGGSDCSGTLSSDGFTSLPCSITYAMSASWVSAR